MALFYNTHTKYINNHQQDREKMIILFFIFLQESKIVPQNILQKYLSTPTKKDCTSVSYKNNSP